MLHESKEESKVEIYNGKITFNDIYEKNNLPIELIESIKNADILLIPHEDFKGFKDCLFPEQTYQFFSYLKKEALKHNLAVDMSVSDDEYKELELHADVVNIAQIIIQWAIFPVVTSMIAAYLYDLVKQRKKKMNANIKISVEQKGKTKTINFEGDIESFERAMKSINENIFE